MAARKSQKQYNAAYYRAHKKKSNAASARYREKHKEDPEFRERRRKAGKKWWGRNGRNLTYTRTYGITAAEFDARVAAQNNRCPIGNHMFGPVGQRGDSPVLDHNHKTGKHRGIICRVHNGALGGFHDSIAELQDAQMYIKKYTGA